MECKELLEVMPVTELVSVMEGARELAYAEVRKVALELPNCILEKKVARLYIGETVGGYSVITIVLEERK